MHVIDPYIEDKLFTIFCVCLRIVFYLVDGDFWNERDNFDVASTAVFAVTDVTALRLVTLVRLSFTVYHFLR